MASVTFPIGLGGDGSTVTDDSNATTGLGNGGHRARFVPALNQTVAMANTSVNSASTASTQAASATASASSASTSATNANNSFLSMDTKYLGEKTGDPTVNNQGGALATGAEYWNSSTSTMRVYNGTSWQNSSALTDFASNTFRISDNTDSTKKVAFNTSGITTGTVRTLTIPNVNGTVITSGDTGTVTATLLANTAVTGGSYGSATQVGTFTVDAQGRLTAASNTSIQIAESQVTNLTTDLGLKAPLASPTFTGTVTTPNLAFNTASGRITGDFSNATYGSRVAFQTSTTNGNTTVQFLPNGTGAYAALNIHNTSDLTNLSLLRLESSSSTNRIASISGGTGTSLPLSLYTNGADRLTIDTSGNSTFTGTVTTPNLAFNTAGGRITGDFSNATFVNRVLFQSSTANGNTSVGFLPNGTATTSNLNLFGGSDPSNCSLLQLVNYTTGGFCFLNSTKIGTGVTQPIQFQINGSSALTIDTSGNSTFTGTVSGSSATGFRNKIINGATDIDQRNNGAATTVEGSFVVDRWRVDFYGTGSAQRIAMSNTPEVPGFSYYIKFARTAGGTNFSSLSTKIEGVKNLSGKAMTISFWVRGDVINASGFTIFSALYDDSGTFQTFGPNNNTAFSITSTWTRVSMRMDMPSVTTSLGANGGYMLLLFRCSSSTENFNISVTGVQWEEGSVATPFERRPYGLELSLCQRYYQTYTVFVSQSATSKTTFPINMRTTPTIGGGGAGFTSTGTTADALHCYQTTGAAQTLTLLAEL